MQIFVSEFLTSGAMDGPLEGSMLREGRAMALAVLQDVATIPAASVVTTWDRRLAEPPLDVRCVRPQNSDDAGELFRQLAGESDLTFTIAPETDGILERQCAIAIAANADWCGASRSVIELAGDKLAFFEHLAALDLPTIPTTLLGNLSDDATEYSRIVKPRFGAGSQDMRRIRSGDRIPPGLPADTIVQPEIYGTPVSVATVKSSDGFQFLPMVKQRLNDDFGFVGGEINTELSPAVEQTVRQVLNSLGDCGTGYFGFDLILPTNGDRRPLVVELNPRLTTSYIGYRRQFPELIQTILFQRASSMTVKHHIEFTAGGTASIKAITT